MSSSTPADIPAPVSIRAKLARLQGFRDITLRNLQQVQSELGQTRRYLQISQKVTAALDQLSESLFRDLLNLIEEKLSIALQEVLLQPIQLKAEVEWKRNAAAVNFWIENDGNHEDIMKGQGGSVANILSVGLRMFALMSLPESEHRRFLVLDEQDCWLKPEIVPRFIKIIHEASTALGFQVLMISHHNTSTFEKYADKIYQLIPAKENSVRIELVTTAPAEDDLIDVLSENLEFGSQSSGF